MLNLLLPGLVNMFLWLPEEKLFRAFLFPDSVERFSLVWVLRLGILSLGVQGVVFLLVVRCLGKYYSHVGRQISPSLSIGAWQDWCK